MNYHKILYLLFPVLAVFCLAGLASCDYIHDELPLCRHTLRFVYRHNIKHADAFAYEMVNQEREKNVRLYIYDDQGGVPLFPSDRGRGTEKERSRPQRTGSG